jgi:hypothetical protein
MDLPEPFLIRFDRHAGHDVISQYRFDHRQAPALVMLL